MNVYELDERFSKFKVLIYEEIKNRRWVLFSFFIFPVIQEHRDPFSLRPERFPLYFFFENEKLKLFYFKCLIMLWIRFRSRFHFHLFDFLPLPSCCFVPSCVRCHERDEVVLILTFFFQSTLPWWKKSERWVGSLRCPLTFAGWKRSKCVSWGWKRHA